MAEKDKKNKKTSEGYSRNRRRKDEQYVDAFSKVPPQALPLEEAVLGALMLDKDALPIVMDILQSDSFYAEGHKLIYKAILRLFEKSQPIDMLTVSEELKKSGDLEVVGGAYALVELTNRVASSANIEYHARIVSQKHIQRELIRVSTNIIKDAYEDTTDVFNLLDEAEKGLFDITQNNLSRNYESMGSLASKTLKMLEELKDKKDGLTGVPTGFTDLDRLTSGWQPSDMIILAARPGMGKTSLVLALAKNAAMDFDKPVAVFSLEMSNVQLVQRLISMEAEIPGSKMRNGKLEEYEWQQLQTAIERMSEVPIFIDDTPGINIFELRAKCRRLKMQHDIQLVIIDYLQLMSGGADNTKGNREQEISAISRALKGMAKELSVPVIALSQLSRAVETRGGTKRPQLSDLRECVTGDTLIYLPEQGIYEKVENLLGTQNFKVLSMDESYRLNEDTCLDVWETGEKEIFEVETHSGFKIKTSLNHPFYTPNGWQQLVDIKEGEYVALGRKVASGSKSDLKDEEIIFLAHMIGDGCYVERQAIHYTSKDPQSRKIVAECAKNLWGIQSRVVPDKNSSDCHHVYLPSPYHLTHGVHHPFINLLNSLNLKKARSFEKMIPDEIFKCNDQQLALFLRHLWSTDGCVSIRKGRGSSVIHYSTNSPKLASQIKLLLLRFGIQSTINKVQKEDYRPNYMVVISNALNHLKFAEFIGVFGEKAEALKQLASIQAKKVYNPNQDIIPKIYWKDVRELKKSKGFTERSFQAALEMQYCGSALYKSNLSRDRMGRVANILEDKNLKNLASSDIKWEKIKSITHLGKEMTYDLHVEHHHNFLANNFIIHNSGAIEQDADMVSFIYRPEYYQILEDEEGQSLKGIAELIIAKNRHGAVKTVKLRFIDEFAKFADLGDPNFDDLPGDTFSPAVDTTNVITRPSKMNDDEDIPF